MTQEENEILTLLGGVFTKYGHLPRARVDGGHPDDLDDFRYHVHRLQDMIAARPVYRDLWTEHAKKGGVE